MLFWLCHLFRLLAYYRRLTIWGVVPKFAILHMTLESITAIDRSILFHVFEVAIFSEALAVEFAYDFGLLLWCLLDAEMFQNPLLNLSLEFSMLVPRKQANVLAVMVDVNLILQVVLEVSHH